MVYFSYHIKAPAFPARFTLSCVLCRLARAISKLRPARPVKSDIDYLLEHSDAELADIGLLRSDLSDLRFDNAADAQAQAMLWVYK